jgi:hypothetical protein
MVVSMRPLILAAVMAAAAASPAAAQFVSPQLEELRMQQEAAQRRAIDQSNQLMALEARLRADQATADLQRPAPRVPEVRYKPAAGTGFTRATPPGYPSIPETTLADSNKRVRDAAKERR